MPGDSHTKADSIVTNARVFTGRPGSRFVEAVAIAGGKVVFVGSAAAAWDFRGPATEVHDCLGSLVTPGFTDAHVHVATSGLEQLRLNFEGCHGPEDALSAIARYVVDNPGDGWVLGGGWSQTWFARGCPDAATLDPIIGSRPAVISNADGHGAWVSTRAMEIAGLDATTPDPADGRIERLPDGTPQGTLHEGAVELVAKHAPVDTADDYVRGLIRGQQEMLRFGITSWQEASVPPRVQEAYLSVANSGKLLGDTVGALWWERHRGLEQVEELVERRRESAPGFRPTTVKLMLDGVAENFTASVLDPYLDESGAPTGNLGVDFIDPAELGDIVTALDRNGFQCHFHALGDRAVRNGLDAIETALRANGPSDNRHHLAHLQFVHPDDIPRFARLEAIANAQPFWACNDDYQVELTRPFVSQERYEGQYPFGALARSGARLGMGSDWNVSTANVMREIDVAVSRTCEGGGEPLGPGQQLTPEEALMAFTLGSAYINHSEGMRGSLEPGKAADLAIFDRDPFAAGPFRDAEVVATIIGGEVVYRRD